MFSVSKYSSKQFIYPKKLFFVCKKNLPKIVVAALVEKDEKFLLVKEVLESGEEYWIIPGGEVKFGEVMEDAVKREIKEETGLDIEIVKMIDFTEATHTKYDYHTVIFLFHARPLNENITLEEKLLDAKFFAKEELKDLNTVSSSKRFLEKYFMQKF